MRVLSRVKVYVGLSRFGQFRTRDMNSKWNIERRARTIRSWGMWPLRGWNPVGWFRTEQMQTLLAAIPGYDSLTYSRKELLS